MFAAFKVIILILIVVTGWAVLGGGTRIKDSHSHFAHGFAGSKFVQVIPRLRSVLTEHFL